MLLHVVVAKTQDTETVVLEIMRPPLVVVVLPCRVMRTAVELDDERGVIAEEIDNIRPDGSLLPEADGVGFEEVVPKMALGGSHVAAEGTGVFLRFCIVCVKHVVFPSLPLREENFVNHQYI